MLSWQKRSKQNAPSRSMQNRPELSVVIIFYNMEREARRTIASLLPPYQRDIEMDDIEIIAIDNGSEKPLGDAYFSDFGDVVTHMRHDTESVSPVEALNIGSAKARGKYVSFIIDGARISIVASLCGRCTCVAVYGFAHTRHTDGPIAVENGLHIIDGEWITIITRHHRGGAT